MEEKGLTVADALALREGNNYNDGAFGGNGAWWVIILILFFAMGGRGFGNWGNNDGGNNGYNVCCTPATQQGVTDAFNFNQLDNGIRGLERGMCDGFYTTNLAVTNLGTQMQQGFCSADRANLQGFNGIQSTLCQGFNGINQAIAQTNYNMKDCCCETRESIMQSNFNNQSSFNAIQNQLASCCCDLGKGQDSIKNAIQQSTCDILIGQERNTDRIINHLVKTEMDNLRNELQSAQFQLSQLSQTRSIIDQLQPCPKPAYPVMSPYQAIPFSAFCGCNNNTCC
jgi:hypothetical protein